MGSCSTCGRMPKDCCCQPRSSKKDLLLERNKKILVVIKLKEEELRKTENSLRALKKAITPPCEFCPYNGVFRCEACAENNYEGFNKRNYLDPLWGKEV